MRAKELKRAPSLSVSVLVLEPVLGGGVACELKRAPSLWQHSRWGGRVQAMREASLSISAGTLEERPPVVKE